MYWNGDHMGWWAYTLMSISMVLFWGLVITGIVVLIRYLARSAQQGESQRYQPTAGERPSAEQVLADRFARGEIDEDDYRRRLETLRANAGTPPPGAPTQSR